MYILIVFRLMWIDFRPFLFFIAFVIIQGGPPRSVNGAERCSCYVAAVQIHFENLACARASAKRIPKSIGRVRPNKAYPYLHTVGPEKEVRPKRRFGP